jgi:hypothetical protein
LSSSPTLQKEPFPPGCPDRAATPSGGNDNARLIIAMKRHLVAVAVTAGAPIFELAIPCEVFGRHRRGIPDLRYDLRICELRRHFAAAAGVPPSAYGRAFRTADR